MALRYYEHGGIAGVETKRGCYHSCIYCIDPVSKGNEVRLRDPRDVGAEIEHLVRSGITVLHMCDSEFNVPEQHAIEVCQEIVSRGLAEAIRWYCYLTPAETSRPLIRWLKRGGCAGVVFCTEHCDDVMLRVMDKGFCFSDVQSASRFCRELSLPFLHSVLLGAPEEDCSTARRCIERLKSLEATVSKASVGVRVYPYTPLASLLRSRQSDVIRSNGELAPITTCDLLEPAFFVSDKISSDSAFDANVTRWIGSDERVVYHGLSSGSAKPSYHYDWMKLASAVNAA
jgi:radical SAM superfamily enzyme YgiQ (UPF0313 family)